MLLNKDAAYRPSAQEILSMPQVQAIIDKLKDNVDAKKILGGEVEPKGECDDVWGTIRAS